MSTKNIIPQVFPTEQANPPEYQPGPLNQRQALTVARLAIAAILLGEPSIETFDVDDLYQSLVVLGRMVGAA
jgi:hypothetical protein